MTKWSPSLTAVMPIPAFGRGLSKFAVPPVPPGGSDGFQAFINTWHDDATRRTCMAGGIVGMRCFMPHARYEESELAGPNLHPGPIFWNGRLYAMPEKDFIRAFDYNTGSKTLATTPAKVSTVRPPDGMPGGALSLSANGNSNGIIWALFPKGDGQWENGPGSLVAFDAASLKEIWRDDDDISPFKPKPVAPAAASAAAAPAKARARRSSAGSPALRAARCAAQRPRCPAAATRSA